MSYRGSENGDGEGDDGRIQLTETMMAQTARRVGTAPAAASRPKIPALNLNGSPGKAKLAAKKMNKATSAAVAAASAAAAAFTLPAPASNNTTNNAQNSTGGFNLNTMGLDASSSYDFSGNNNNAHHDHDHHEGGDEEEGHYHNYGNTTNTTHNEQASSSSGASGNNKQKHEYPVPDDLKVLLTTLANKSKSISKAEFRNEAKTRVLEQAYMRCLNAVEEGAHMDDRTTGEAKQMLDDWKHSAANKRREHGQQMQQLRASLDAQIAHNTKKEEDARKDQHSSICGYILPVGEARKSAAALAATKYDEQGNPISARIVVSKQLKEQIQNNASDREKFKTDTLHKERAYLDRLAMEIDLHNAEDRSKHLEKQRMLLEAWERDGHIRNLKKLQPFGVQPVQDYIQRNLAADPFATSTGPLNYTSTLGNSYALAALTKPGAPRAESPTIAAKLSKSIGYDPRRAKADW
jgi:hypothetical protein